jgi:hypothetical protein
MLQNGFVISHWAILVLQTGKFYLAQDSHLASAPAQALAFSPLASGRGHFICGIQDHGLGWLN